MNLDELLDVCFDGPPVRPGKREEIHMLDENTRAVLSHVDLSYKRVVVGRTTLTIAALSNLCTDPDHRGKGYAKALVRRAHAEVSDHPMIHFVGVFSPVPGLFEPLGYRQVDPVANPDLLIAKIADEDWPGGLIDVRGGW